MVNKQTINVPELTEVISKEKIIITTNLKFVIFLFIFTHQWLKLHNKHKILLCYMFLNVLICIFNLKDKV